MAITRYLAKQPEMLLKWPKKVCDCVCEIHYEECLVLLQHGVSIQLSDLYKSTSNCIS